MISHDGEARQFALRRLVRYINGNFKVSGRAADVEIFSDNSVPPGEPRLEIYSRKHRIYVNPQDDWQRDNNFCFRLIHLLLSAKCGRSAADLKQLPDWFIAGISQVVSEQTGSARLIRNQHTFTLLDMLAENGCFGNPADVLDVELKQLSEEEKKFFYEYSKLVMLTLDKSRGFSRLAVIIGDDPVIDSNKFNAAARRILENNKDELISPVYRRIMWSDIVPPPEKFTLNCLEKALVSDVPELDKEGYPTGKILKVRLEDFAKLSNREDFLFICRRAASRLQTVSVGESRSVRKQIADLRYHLEEEIFYQTGRQQNVEKSTQITTSQTPNRKTAGPTVKSSQQNIVRTKQTRKNDDADFDRLMNNSSDKDFQKSMKKFYQEKVISSVKEESVTGKLNRMFSAESKLDSQIINKYIAGIKAALEQRAELRAYLDATVSSMTPVQNLIRFRKRIIYSGGQQHVLWLEKVRSELY